MFNVHVSIMKMYVPRRELNWEPWNREQPNDGVDEGEPEDGINDPYGRTVE